MATNARYLEACVAAIRVRLQCLAEAEMLPPMGWPEPPLGEMPALLRLERAFGLSAFETAVLALCAAHELDLDIGSLCARASGDLSRPWPSFGLALEAFAPGAWDALSAAGPLRHWQLIIIERRAGEPLLQAPMRCDERILDFIKGLTRLGVPAIAELCGFSDTAMLADAAACATLTQLWEADGTRRAMLFGTDMSSRRAVAIAAAFACGIPLFRIEAESIPGAPGEAEQFALLWNREARLGRLALLIEISRPEDEALVAALRRVLSRAAFSIALSADAAQLRFSELGLAIAVAPPDHEAQAAAWQLALGEGHARLARRLAAEFDFTPQMIAELGSFNAKDDGALIWLRCVAGVRPRLDALAQRITPRARWDDLILPAEQQCLLRQLIDQVRLRNHVYDHWGYRARLNRGLGIIALFAGESGTGKTMAAEVLAGVLELNLYRIDLSSVVSKYIGETEKNLRQLFDAAEQGGAILFFDEADALFGKRGEVKDSHDRHANIEVNYLLQRIESFHGLAILATNMKAAMDAAFLRRMRFVVRFPHPGQAERRRMWERVFPAQVPLDELDYDRLGRINLTGGHIAAAALNAAFLAAAAGARVGMGQVLAAARTELIKLNRPFSESEFVLPKDLTMRNAAE